MREAGPDLHLILGRVERTETHGVRQVFDRYVRLTTIESQQAAEDPRGCKVRIDQNSSVDEGGTAIEIADEKT